MTRAIETEVQYQWPLLPKISKELNYLTFYGGLKTFLIVLLLQS